MSDVRTDAELASELPGAFSSRHAELNGTRLHYVLGEPQTKVARSTIVLLPGWPHTWWSFRKILEPLTQRHRVVAVDLRGMGGSAKPGGGYDKKTMAGDIDELIRHLGHEQVDVVGHDIGSMVAYALAANYPTDVRRLAFLDVFHPDKGFLDLRLLPGEEHAVNPGEHGPAHHLWWFALNQLDDLPERLLAGRMRELIRWLWEYQAVNKAGMTDRDLAVYADRYDAPEAIRAGNRWYQTFRQDIADASEYPLLTTPTLGLPGVHMHEALRESLAQHVAEFSYVPVPDSGHYLAEEQPEFITEKLLDFFD